MTFVFMEKAGPGMVQNGVSSERISIVGSWGAMGSGYDKNHKSAKLLNDRFSVT